jgi:mono/diheme cytochrome c family protein
MKAGLDSISGRIFYGKPVAAFPENALTIAVIVAVLGLALASAGAQGPQFPSEQVARGAQLFAMNCATCHGTRMRNPQWAIDLHTFPRDAKARFVDSVINGKRNMPPWDDMLKPDDLDALWAYVSTGDPGD